MDALGSEEGMTANGSGADGEIATFEEAFGALQDTIARLEEGGLPLDVAIETFERGMQLASHCGSILDSAELRVTRVLETHALDPDEPAF